MISAAFRKKLAFVTCVVPPAPSGQAMVLYRLLGNLDSDDYCLISVRHGHDPLGPESDEQTLPATCHPLHPPEIQLKRPRWYLPKSAYYGLNFVLKVLHRARRIRNIVRIENCNAVVGCTGDIHDLPAAYLAARWAGLPFYAYAFDYYSFQCKSAFPPAYAVTRRIERFILRRSAGVIVPNEFLREEYRRNYGVTPVVIHNPAESSTAAASGLPGERVPLLARIKSYTSGFVSHVWGRRRAAAVKEVRIVYTGSVYAAQFDAFRNLLDALEKLGRPEIKLHIYTAQSAEQLAGGGIVGSFVHHPQLPLAESLEIQRAADILFLPLAFQSPYPEVINTSAPGKLGEYLASGRPILVHAPAESFLAWYFKKHECGLVVDRPEPKSLGEAVLHLLDGPALCERLIRNARARAADFDLERSRSALADVLMAKGAA